MPRTSHHMMMMMIMMMMIMMMMMMMMIIIIIIITGLHIFDELNCSRKLPGVYKVLITFLLLIKGQLKSRNNVILRKAIYFVVPKFCQICKLCTKKLSLSCYTEIEGPPFCFLWLPLILNMGNGRRCRDVIYLNNGESILVEFFCLFAPLCCCCCCCCSVLFSGYSLLFLVLLLLEIEQYVYEPLREHELGSDKGKPDKENHVRNTERWQSNHLPDESTGGFISLVWKRFLISDNFEENFKFMALVIKTYLRGSSFRNFVSSLVLKNIAGIVFPVTLFLLTLPQKHSCRQSALKQTNSECSEQNSMPSDYSEKISSLDFNSHCFLRLSFPSENMWKFVPLLASLRDLLKQPTTIHSEFYW